MEKREAVRLRQIINEIKAIREEKILPELKDDTILDVSIRILNSELIDKRKRSYYNHKQGKNYLASNHDGSIPFKSPANNQDEQDPYDLKVTSNKRTGSPDNYLVEPEEDKQLATANQLFTLKRMGYPNDTSKLTKYEAWHLIKGGKKSWVKNYML